MKQAGRASVLVIVASIVTAILVVILLLGGESATSAAGKFMQALGRGNVDTLVDLSYMEGETHDSLAKKWDFTVHRAGPYYRFQWNIKSAIDTGPDTAVVKMVVFRNSANPTAYDEPFDLPMKNVDGGWKVDVRGMPRTLYPGLPR